METREISTLKINTLVSQEQYDKAYDENKIEQDSIYLVPDNTEEIAQEKANKALQSAKEYTDLAIQNKANTDDLTNHTEDTTIHVTEEDKSKWNAKADAEHNHDGVYYTEAEIDNKTTVIEQSLTAQGNEIEVVKGDLTSHATSSNAQFGTIREEFAAKDAENLTTAKEYSDANKSAAISEAKAYTDSEIEKLVTDTEFEGVLSTIQDIQNAMATDDELAQALETANGKKVDKGAKGSTTKPIYFDENGAQEIAYSIEKDVPADAKFTDTTYTLVKDATNKKIQLMSGETLISEVDDNNTTYDTVTTSNSGLMSKEDKIKLDTIETGANAYTHPTTAGNKHIPSGGSSGQILTYSTSGTAKWADPPSSGIDGLTATVDELNYSSGLTGNIQEQLDEINNLFFEGDATLVIGNNATRVASNKYEGSDFTGVVLSNSVENIGYAAFRNSPNLTFVAMSDEVTTLGNQAFYGCNSLKHIKLSNSLEKIDRETFYNCKSLYSIDMPTALTSVGYYAFYNCTGLTKINITDLKEWCKVDLDTFYTNPLYYGSLYLNGEQVTNLIIPDGTTKIGKATFYKESQITSVTFPNTLISIDSYAFQDCNKLTSIIIPEGVKSIDYNAFTGCTKISTISLPDTLYEIGYDNFNDTAYYNNTDNWNQDCLYIGNHLIKVNSINSDGIFKINDGTKSIAGKAFYNLTTLTNIEIPNSVEGIAYQAFYGCKGLTSIHLGSNIKHLGLGSFRSCSNLKDVYIDDLKKYCEIQIPPAGSNVGTYHELLQGRNLYINNTLVTDLVIPDGVTEIIHGSFKGCKSITSVTIPGTVKNIGTYSFASCSYLNNIILNEGVEVIESNAFENCSTTCSIHIPSTLKRIGYPYTTNIKHIYVNDIKDWCNIEFETGSLGNYMNLYVNNTLLKELTIPSSVTEIKPYAFRSISSFTKLNLPSNLTKIGTYAFAYTGITSLNLPSSLQVMENYAFMNSSITELNIGNCTADINYMIFDSCWIKNITASSTNSRYATLNNILLSKDLRTLYLYPIGNTNTNYTVPESVTDIAEASFKGCSKLTSIAMLDNVLHIGNSAFNGCKNITDINLSNNLLTIGQRAFYDCSALTAIEIPDSVRTIGERAFYNCNKLTSINIPSNMEIIEQYTFYNTPITSITIPKNIESIKNNAFYYCQGLSTVIMEYGLKDIGAEAFANCVRLTEVVIPDSVTTIGASAFNSCTKLTTITIGKRVSHIADVAFSECTALTKVNILDLYNWCNIDFDNNKANPLFFAKNLYLNDELLTNLVIPQGVENIKNQAFRNFTSLKSLTLADSVTSIGSYAFNGCTSLTSIIIPDSVTSIGSYAFNDCTGLTDVYFKGTEKQWNAITKGSYNTPLTSATIHYNYTGE